MKSFFGALQFCLVISCVFGALLGLGAALAGYWWLGIPMIFCSVWAAMSITEEPW